MPAEEAPYDPYIPSGQAAPQQGAGNARTQALQAVGAFDLFAVNLVMDPRLVPWMDWPSETGARAGDAAASSGGRHSTILLVASITIDSGQGYTKTIDSWRHPSVGAWWSSGLFAIVVFDPSKEVEGCVRSELRNGFLDSSLWCQAAPGSWHQPHLRLRSSSVHSRGQPHRNLT